MILQIERNWNMSPGSYNNLTTYWQKTLMEWHKMGIVADKQQELLEQWETERIVAGEVEILPIPKIESWMQPPEGFKFITQRKMIPIYLMGKDTQDLIEEIKANSDHFMVRE